MSKPINPVEKFLIRYNFVILVVLAAAVLSVSVYLSYEAYISSTNPSETAIKSDVPTNFDAATSEKIEQLHRSDDPDISVTPPAGRINPFSE